MRPKNALQPPVRAAWKVEPQWAIPNRVALKSILRRAIGGWRCTPNENYRAAWDAYQLLGTAMGLLHEGKRDVGAEMIEVVRFAEEFRQVGGDRIDEVFELGFVLCQILAILDE